MNGEQTLSVDSKPVHSLHEAVLVMLSNAGAVGVGYSNESIHSVRKELKRIRAALRLMRPALGGRNFRWANREVRDAAKPLTSVRDAAVHLNTLEAIGPRRAKPKTRALIAVLHQDLTRNCDLQRRALTASQLREVTVRLEQTAEYLRLPIHTMPDSVAAKRGMKNVYRAGRDAYRAARQHATVETLHDWRKQVKYLFEESQLLHSVYQVEMPRLSRRSQRLADLLGREHDLALFREILKKYDSSESRRLLGRIRRKRHQLQAQALDIGRRLYRRPPRKFVLKVRGALRQSLS